MANAYKNKNTIRLSAAFSLSGTATDPTTGAFKIRRPNGVEISYVYGTDVQLVKASTGNYYVDWLLGLAGVHYYGFVGTGACAAADEASFEVKENKVI